MDRGRKEEVYLHQNPLSAARSWLYVQEEGWVSLGEEGGGGGGLEGPKGYATRAGVFIETGKRQHANDFFLIERLAPVSETKRD